MDTSSRTKSVERPVRAVDLFIASLDALTLLEGSSTLSAQIDSDERATLLASFGRPVCRTSDEWRGRRRNKGFARERENRLIKRMDGKKKRNRFNEKVHVKKQEKRNERENELIGPLADSSNSLHSSNERICMK